MFDSNSESNEQAAKNTGAGNVPDGDRPEWKILEKVALASVVEQRKARRWGIFFKSLTFIYIFFFIALMMPSGEHALGPTGKKHVGLVSIDGMIAADAQANANDIVGALRNAFKAENSVGVIVAINSPGGSPVQAGYVNDEIFRLKALHPEKKVYAVIADMGASGGYYIASAADEIYADKASLVGSIGVISAGFGVSGLMEKIGVDRRVYHAGESKNFLDMFSPEREEDREFWQGVLDVTHSQFMEVVRRGRGDRLLEDDDTFSGLIWTGEQALARGLIDGLGSAGYVAREVIGTEEIRDYTLVTNPWDEFARRFGVTFASSMTKVLAPVLR